MIPIEEQIAAVRRCAEAHEQWLATVGSHPTAEEARGRSDLAALRAALATLEASRWRPISEAPKVEGEWLLGCRAAAKLPGIIGWDEEEGKWFWLNGMFRGPCEPTHFMPIPTPPLTEAGDA